MMGRPWATRAAGALACLWLSACSSGPFGTDGADGSDLRAGAFPIVTCTVHYRPTVAQGFTDEREVTLKPGDSPTSLEFEEVTIAFTYEHSEQEGGTLYVDERPSGAEDSDYFHRSLYQFLPDQVPTGEVFGGGHGFTGLAYVQAPGSTAEAQYICTAEAQQPK